MVGEKNKPLIVVMVVDLLKKHSFLGGGGSGN